MVDERPPVCKKCGKPTNWRGYETFAKEPHKRRKCSCTECGHTFVPKIQEQTVTQQIQGSPEVTTDVAGKSD